MKIIELRAENFKRLSAVRITPDGGLVQITGRNGAGKTSVLDAIAAALGGKDAVPGKPIRAGAERAEVRVDLGDLIVTRRFTGDDKSSLVVENREGLRYQSPQSVLDALLGRLSFDPLAFGRMPAKTQAATLRELVGLDTTTLDARRAEVFARRAEANKDLKRAQVQLDDLPQVGDDVPDAEVSLVDLAGEHKRASATIAENQRKRRGAEVQRKVVAEITAEIARREDQIRRLQVEIEEARGRLDENDKKLMAADEAIAALVDPDLDEIAHRMETAQRTNEAVRVKKARAAKEHEVMQRQGTAAMLTEQIEQIDAAKQRALAEARFPVTGLSLDGDVVTFNGVPLDQASGAEQLRVGLAIGAALNPKLRVILVRDGSLLDTDGLRLVAEWAEASGMQVIMERVADGSRVGIVIEDGEVAAQNDAPVEAEASL
jgi:DNA repair exonuclease SbcCD ATPase subunit